MNDHWKSELIKAAKELIRTEAACRANKWSWAAFHPPKDSPDGKEYHRVSEEHYKATAEFWMLTDVEYSDEDPLRAACWQWRYCKVMARKCIHIQKKQSIFGTRAASKLMNNLHKAETHLYDLLGLSAEYKSPSQYIEEHFPNLKIQD